MYLLALTPWDFFGFFLKMQQKHYADVQVFKMTAKNSLLLFSSIKSYTKKGEVISQGFLGER